MSNTTEVQVEMTDFLQPGQVALRMALDAFVYILMVFWLTFKAWQVPPPCVHLAIVDSRRSLARARPFCLTAASVCGPALRMPCRVVLSVALFYRSPRACAMVKRGDDRTK